MSDKFAAVTNRTYPADKCKICKKPTCGKYCHQFCDDYCFENHECGRGC